MKKIFIVFAVFTVINSVRSETIQLTELIKHKHVRHLFAYGKEKFSIQTENLETRCSRAGERLNSAMTHLSDCANKIDDSLTICEIVRKYTVNCTNPLNKVLDECHLEQPDRGLFTFFTNSIMSAVEFLCKQTGESLFELANPCLWRNLDESNEQLMACDRRVREIAEKHRDQNTSIDEICDSADSFRSCVQLRAQHSCKNPKTRNVTVGLYDAVFGPCKDTKSDRNTM